MPRHAVSIERLYRVWPSSANHPSSSARDFNTEDEAIDFIQSILDVYKDTDEITITQIIRVTRQTED